MDDDTDTKVSRRNGTSTPTSEAEKAYIYKQQGKRLGWIVDHTIYRDATEVQMAIKNYMISTRLKNEQEERDQDLQIEIERLDAVMDEMWEIMTGGDNKDAIAAAKNIMQAVKQRTDLKGFAKIDPVAGASQVLIIQGDTSDYIKSLKSTLPSHVLENRDEETT